MAFPLLTGISECNLCGSRFDDEDGSGSRLSMHMVISHKKRLFRAAFPSGTPSAAEQSRSKAALRVSAAESSATAAEAFIPDHGSDLHDAAAEKFTAFDDDSNHDDLSPTDDSSHDDYNHDSSTNESLSSSSSDSGKWRRSNDL